MGEVTQLGSPQTFQVKSIIKGALPTQSNDVILAYRAELGEMSGAMSAVNYNLNHTEQKLGALATALSRTSGDTGSSLSDIREATKELKQLQIKLNGHPIKGEIGERSNPTMRSRYSVASRGANSSYGPTKMHREQLALAKKEFNTIKSELTQLSTKVNNIEQTLIKMGAPYIQGQNIPEISGN